MGGPGISCVRPIRSARTKKAAVMTVAAGMAIAKTPAAKTVSVGMRAAGMAA